MPVNDRMLVTYAGLKVGFKPVPTQVNNPAALAAANTANAKLSDAIASYHDVEAKLKFYAPRLADLDRSIRQYRLNVIKQGDSYVLASPLHNNRIFGSALKSAKQVEEEPSGPFVPNALFRPPTESEWQMSGGPPIVPPSQFIPFEASLPTPPAGAAPAWAPAVQPQSAEPVTKIWVRAPNGRLVLKT
jgi:hypothetical protein